MATHVMTPARRAALRKAQLVSAQKRRKYGVKYQAKNVARQKIAYAKVNKRKVAKYAALGATLAGVGAAAYVGTKTPTYKYNKGMTKSTIKAYRGGKRGQSLATHRNRVRPIIAKNAGGHRPRYTVRSQPSVGGNHMRPHMARTKAGRAGFATVRGRDYVAFSNPNRKR